MVMVNSDALLGEGFRFRIFSVGASVALSQVSNMAIVHTTTGAYSARAAKVSIIRLTHNSCTALRTLWFFEL